MTSTRSQPMSRVLSVVLAACLALAACGANTPPEPTVDQATQQFNQLMQRPDIDQVTARYQQMYLQVRQRLSGLLPTLTWSQSLGVMGAACGPEFAAVDASRPQDDAITRSLGNWDLNGTILDAQWTNALAAIADVVQGYGFDPRPEVIVSKPGNHNANFYDSYRAKLTVDVGNTAGLSLSTGCHLTAEAKKRGHPAPIPTY
jgi:hypothetical protein